MVCQRAVPQPRRQLVQRSHSHAACTQPGLLPQRARPLQLQPGPQRERNAQQPRATLGRNDAKARDNRLRECQHRVCGILVARPVHRQPRQDQRRRLRGRPLLQSRGGVGRRAARRKEILREWHARRRVAELHLHTVGKNPNTIHRNLRLCHNKRRKEIAGCGTQWAQRPGGTTIPKLPRLPDANPRKGQCRRVGLHLGRPCQRRLPLFPGRRPRPHGGRHTQALQVHQ